MGIRIPTATIMLINTQGSILESLPLLRGLESGNKIFHFDGGINLSGRGIERAGCYGKLWLHPLSQNLFSWRVRKLAMSFPIKVIQHWENVRVWSRVVLNAPGPPRGVVVPVVHMVHSDPLWSTLFLILVSWWTRWAKVLFLHFAHTPQGDILVSHKKIPAYLLISAMIFSLTSPVLSTSLAERQYREWLWENGYGWVLW